VLNSPKRKTCLSMAKRIKSCVVSVMLDGTGSIGKMYDENYICKPQRYPFSEQQGLLCLARPAAGRYRLHAGTEGAGRRHGTRDAAAGRLPWLFSLCREKGLQRCRHL